MSIVSSAFSVLVHLICGPSQHTSILPHINPNLSLSLESYRFLVWLELFVPFQALVGFSGILYASLSVVLINVVGSCKAFLIKSTTKLQSPLRWKIGKESKETTPTHHEQPSLILHPFFCLYSYTLRVVGNGIKAQAENPEVKVKEADPVISQVIDKLKHINQVSPARKHTVKWNNAMSSLMSHAVLFHELLCFHASRSEQISLALLMRVFKTC